NKKEINTSFTTSIEDLERKCEVETT
ncbi:jg15223, partial [Pararge aegeria aegeria]